MIRSFIILLPLFVCASIAVELLLKKKSRPRWCLLFWAVTATLLYACHAQFFFHVSFMEMWRHVAYVVCNLWVFPLFLIYISELSEPRPLSRRPVVWALLAPGVVGGAAMAAVCCLVSEQEAADFMQQYLYHGSRDALSGYALTASYVSLACKVAFALEVALTMILGARMLWRYDSKLELYYADEDKYSLRKVRILLMLLCITSLLSVMANFVGRSAFVDSEWLLAVPALAFSAMLYSVGYVCTDLEPVDVLTQMSEIEEEEESLATEAPNANLQLGENLNRLMDEEQIFLKPDLKLQDLATALGTNRTYLLWHLRTEYGMTFSEFVNRRRIAHARRLMQQHPEWKKVRIASASGYALGVTFYRNWKKYGEEQQGGETD